MKDSSFHLNEVAHAYERNFSLLEAAREEYSRTVTEILRQFHQRLLARIGTLDGAVQFIPSLKEDGFLSEVACLLNLNDRTSGFHAFAKAAVPQGGSASCLRIDAYGWFDEKLAPVTRDRAFDRSGDFPEADRSTGFLESREVTIADGNMDAAVDSILETVERLTPFALEQIEEEACTTRICNILDRVVKNLQPPPRLATVWSNKPSLAWWKGMRYIQPALPNCPGFWVGYHVRDGRLMYGHHLTPSNPGFTERYYSLAGASPVQSNDPMSYGGNPAGVILERNALRERAEEEIEEVVTGAFLLFFDLLSESPPVTSRSDSADDSLSAMP